MSGHRSADDPRLYRNLNLAFVFTVLAAFVPTVLVSQARLTTGALLSLTGLGLAYILMGLYGAPWFFSRGSQASHLAYFALQLALVGLTMGVSPTMGALWLMPLPLVSQAVMGLPRRWMWTVCALVLMVFLLPLGPQIGWLAAASGSVTFLAAIIFVVVFSQVYVSEQRARAEVERLAAQLQQANRQLRDYALQVEELATMRERNRLAREIHDSLGHYLTVVNVQLEAARAVFAREPAKALEALRKAQALTREGLAEVRRSVAALRASPIENRDLAQALEPLLEECRTAGLVADLKVKGEVEALDPRAAHALYRAAQEALTNVRKHSRATRVQVTLDFQRPDRVCLTVADNGVGLQPQALDGPGFGLLGLRERVGQLGGNLEFRRNEPQGLALQVSLPRGGSRA